VAETSNTPKKPIYKRWWVIALAVLILIGILAPKDKSAKKDLGELQGAARIEAVLSNAAPAKTRAEYDSVNHVATLIYEPGTAFDEKNLLKDHLSRGITFARKAFTEVPDLTKVTVASFIEMTDINGKASNTMVMRHSFARGPFMEVDWSKFDHAPMFNQVMKSLEGQAYIHPSVAKAIPQDWIVNEMYYVP
jgi:hypothetical protein